MSDSNVFPNGVARLQVPVPVDEYSRGLKWSIFAHAAFAAFVILKALVFPGKPVPIAPALRVDIVGLPDILKKDLAKIPKTAAPVETAPPPLEKAPETERPAPKEPALPKVASPKEQASPDEMVLKPKQAAKEREKKLKSALARIKSLEKIKDDLSAETPKPKATLVKGNIVSKGTSLSADARESSEASYYDLVRDKLQNTWALPVWLARQKLSAQVMLRIDLQGRVRGLTITKSSGNAQFDEAVRRAINEAQPFPVPPEEIGNSVMSNGILVGFPL